jgi:putative aldouronate transport system permease protein
VLKIFFGQLAPIIFALLLNEVRHTIYKRTVQTLTYLPHFLSWVMIGGIFIDILSTQGIINRILNQFGVESIFFLGSNKWFRTTLVVTDVWKGFGWGSILYMAALSGINQELYESAVLDGANRLQQTWYVTLPGIVPTIVLLATLSLGNILNAGFEQIFNLYNPAVYETGDVIDTFVYRMGLLDTQFSLATAVGLFKSVVSFILIVISYKLANKYTNYRIF